MSAIARVKILKAARPIATKSSVPMDSAFGFCDIGGESGLAIGLATQQSPF